jgi:glycosyltransferase involved in cell wall biosynthesis
MIPMIELSRPGSRLKRYFLNSLATMTILARGRHRTVFVQVPSIVLGVLAVIFSRVFGYKLVIDAHNAVIEGAERAAQPIRFFYRLVIRKADRVIVTNAALAERLRRLGGEPAILPDPVPVFRSGAAVESDASRVVVISTWAQDEPLGEILAAAKLLPEPLSLTITGRARGPFAHEARQLPNVHLSGFVSDEEYLQLLSTARVVIDLTTREDCLVCGAYEALALGRPLIVSDSRALRELLRGGAAFCVNEAAAIAAAIQNVSQNEEQWAARCASRRESYIREWRETANHLLADVTGDLQEQSLRKARTP